MIARKCDRCGKHYDYYSKEYLISEKEYQINAISLLEFNVRGDSCDGQLFYDLCPDCLEEVISFIQNNILL